MGKGKGDVGKALTLRADAGYVVKDIDSHPRQCCWWIRSATASSVQQQVPPDCVCVDALYYLGEASWQDTPSSRLPYEQWPAGEHRLAARA